MEEKLIEELFMVKPVDNKKVINTEVFNNKNYTLDENLEINIPILVQNCVKHCVKNNSEFYWNTVVIKWIEGDETNKYMFKKNRFIMPGSPIYSFHFGDSRIIRITNLDNGNYKYIKVNNNHVAIYNINNNINYSCEILPMEQKRHIQITVCSIMEH